MRVLAPAPFELTLSGGEGPYLLRFKPTDAWDGTFEVFIGGHHMAWEVLTVDREADGSLTLSGSTYGSRALCGDEFWYVLHIEPGEPFINSYGNQVCWRTDRPPET